MTTRVPPVDSTAGFTAVEANTESRLKICLSDDFESLTPEHNLLVGFHFGSQAAQHEHPAIINLRLQPLEREQIFENWWYKGEVTYTSSGSVSIAECQDYTVASVQMGAVAAGDFRAQTRQAYRELLKAVSSTKHQKLVKIWNYFDNINSGDGDFEKYRQFSIGRAEVFRELEISDIDAPTGTAIGSQDGSGLTFIALASNQDYCSIENPRQVSAYNYPRIYGPSSPKFSRGGVVSLDSHKLFLISGTAAVVGHKSNFPYDTQLQSKDTVKNLGHLCEAGSHLGPGETQLVLDENSILRVYLKDPDDYHSVFDTINKLIKNDRHHVAFLHGTICRKELMVEIDGVKVL